MANYYPGMRTDHEEVLWELDRLKDTYYFAVLKSLFGKVISIILTQEEEIRSLKEKLRGD